MTRRRRVPAGLLVLLASVVFATVVLALISAPVMTDQGSLCGRVWTFRPGHTHEGGGERTPADIHAETVRCQNDALVRWRLAQGAGVASVLAFGTGVLLLVGRSGRAEAREGEVVAHVLPDQLDR